MTEAIVHLDPTTRDMQIRITGFPLVAAHLSRSDGGDGYARLEEWEPLLFLVASFLSNIRTSPG